MKISLTIGVWAVLMAMGMTAHGGDDALQELRAPHRSESLEIPGLTAGCHICEWRPSPNQMPAAEQCGLDESGHGKVGLFECGFAENCSRECHFIRCGTL